MLSKQRLITRAELAGYLGLPVATLAQWTYRGTGPRSIKVGRHVRYRMSDVEAWLDAQSRGAA
ncbi:helix-turn-helix transcriptional regulator [Streptomyces sp. NPDC127178]|uniref:helix-turn-helix transcriptional regulator n=1 Tax=unclassified Streptomyces TaxID=2593676 RepID=UPI00362B735B